MWKKKCVSKICVFFENNQCSNLYLVLSCTQLKTKKKNFLWSCVAFSSEPLPLSADMTDGCFCHSQSSSPASAPAEFRSVPLSCRPFSLPADQTRPLCFLLYKCFLMSCMKITTSIHRLQSHVVFISQESFSCSALDWLRQHCPVCSQWPRTPIPSRLCLNIPMSQPGAISIQSCDPLLTLLFIRTAMLTWPCFLRCNSLQSLSLRTQHFKEHSYIKCPHCTTLFSDMCNLLWTVRAHCYNLGLCLYLHGLPPESSTVVVIFKG